MARSVSILPWRLSSTARSIFIPLFLTPAISLADVQVEYVVRTASHFVALTRFEGTELFPTKQFLLDTDGSFGTGYPFGDLGADFLVENGKLYRYQGPDWRWQLVGPVEWLQRGALVQWQIPIGSLNSSGALRMVAVALDGQGSAQQSGAVSSRDWTTTSRVLTPLTLRSRRGGHSDQPLSVLATKELSGDQDIWRYYIEFYPESRGYLGIFTFTLPETISPETVVHLQVETNYRGEMRRYQRWIWDVRDFTASSWYYLGDNTGAEDWRWRFYTFSPAQLPWRFFNQYGRLKVRFRTPDDLDVGQLDLLRVAIQVVLPAGDPPASDPDLWRPQIGQSWQWQLQGTIDLSVDAEIFDIDLFDVPKETIDQLHQMGKRVVCYFSAGTREEWRPDADQFPEEVLGKNVDGWPGERWLDIRRIDLLAPIMTARLDLAARKGCDAVEPDNVDGYENDTGFPLTAEDQLAFNRMLADEAHRRGLAIALKNALGLVAELSFDFDFAINESCFAYNECSLLQPFLDQGKAVLGVSYVEDPAEGEAKAAQVCPQANALGFSWLIKTWDLGSWRIDCRGF